MLERHTLAFLKSTFNTTDFDISRIDFAFIGDYEFYLRPVRRMGNNAVVKHMKMFREMASKEFTSDRLAQVRDTFLFCCFTGLAYSDVQKLKKKPDSTRD